MKKALESTGTDPCDHKKTERNEELSRKIIIGSILQKIHKEQGTMPYLLEVIEPYLTKENRKLFGLFF